MSEKQPIVAIVGTGLIGSSLALALKESGYCSGLLGFDVSFETLEHARQRGAVAVKLLGLRDAAMADVIILSAPVGAIVSSLHKLGQCELRASLILDTGSFKTPVLEAASSAGLGKVFVGGHPMAGAPESGPLAARADLFKDKTFFLVPTPDTSDETLELASQLVRAAGAVPVRIEAEEHDKTVALTSHLPYLLATALSGLASGQVEELTSLRSAIAGAFQDLTRLTEGSPRMWADILAGNLPHIKDWLQKLHKIASDLLAVAEDPAKLQETLAELRESHRKLLD